MGRELWLMRHGKAERYDGIEDYDRPLKKRGKRAARAIGQWLKDCGLRPDSVVSSPARRAISTAKIVCDTHGIEHKDIQQEKRLYDEGLIRTKSVLADCPRDSQRVLLVGHNPELEELLSYLVGTEAFPETQKLLPTATLARLALPDDWSHLDKHCGELLSMTYPRALIGEEKDDLPD